MDDQVNELIRIQDKNVLKEKLLELLEENRKLKERVFELEDTLDGGSIYMIDCDPDNEKEEASNKNEENITNGSNIDTSLATCDGYVSIFEDPTSKDDEKPKSNRNACWNCGGSHGLRDCKEVKNYAKINAAREEFQKSKKVSSSRYFKESGLDVDVQPGLPSEKLQAALGMYAICMYVSK